MILNKFFIQIYIVYVLIKKNLFMINRLLLTKYICIEEIVNKLNIF